MFADLLELTMIQKVVEILSKKRRLQVFDRQKVTKQKKIG